MNLILCKYYETLQMSYTHYIFSKKKQFKNKEKNKVYFCTFLKFNIESNMARKRVKTFFSFRLHERPFP